MKKGCVMREVEGDQPVSNFKRPGFKNTSFYAALTAYSKAAQNKRRSSFKLIFVHQGAVNELVPFFGLLSGFNRVAANSKRADKFHSVIHDLQYGAIVGRTGRDGSETGLISNKVKSLPGH